ncbi:type I-E CRISPR-associated protein Cas6/Cse3/CasE [Nocardiopsis changdeensis]|uniref:Type I-E CRISPR-associated protein Cas6/Cse3/CasE n=1 Tax=Nocardiopsis changdeensis TaxID=2831969 RepID=A0ABX8BFS5_9ACTN|nr:MULTISPECIES: type I-E CRISPR-associated protein Cas6/Cse3/CasE [Nocardiopsis]QUX21090.1 type I-E CRISPR-associated protein Cas6/Cse3/CasE [Nocardiopsis changdeensis]QYX37020.1 type I-E CRISPR-associated protein Cas6/Cse3/CasE [Nocardiopsis sp. MT53]
MYLTRFRFNTNKTGSRRLLSSPQVLHAAVMGCFPEILPSEPGGPRVLWRLDRNSRAEVLLYVVSPTRPLMDDLMDQAGWRGVDDPERVWKSHDYTGFLDRLSKGQTWAFRLTANPVHSIRRKDGEPTKVTAHVTPRHQAGWLIQRQDASGFVIVRKPSDQQLLPGEDEYELTVHDRNAAGFDKPDPRPDRRGKRMRVPIVTATFDGRLTVTDPEALRRVLCAGLGRAKAYGCGLMTLAPVGTGR